MISSTLLNLWFEFIRLFHRYIHKLHLMIILKIEATVQLSGQLTDTEGHKSLPDYL